MQRLKLTFSADPDDAYAWWGALSGRVSDSAITFQPSTSSIAEINAACQQGEPDVAAISAAAYPLISRDYVVLSSGASVGRGYGPALVAREGASMKSALAGHVAIAGSHTTGGLVFRLLHPFVTTVELHWSHIPDAIRSGEVSAGVCIHETLMSGMHTGLHRVGCLGAQWTEQTGLPLPVGLVVARRSLVPELIGRIGSLLARSVAAAAQHRVAALDYARSYSLGLPEDAFRRYVDCFTNDDTLALPPDCIAALNRLYRLASLRGLLPHVLLTHVSVPQGSMLHVAA